MDHLRSVSGPTMVLIWIGLGRAKASFSGLIQPKYYNLKSWCSFEVHFYMHSFESVQFLLSILSRLHTFMKLCQESSISICMLNNENESYSIHWIMSHWIVYDSERMSHGLLFSNRNKMTRKFNAINNEAGFHSDAIKSRSLIGWLK